MFAFERLRVEKWKGKPLALVGVNTDSPKTLSKYVENGRITWRSFYDGEVGGPFSSQWDIVGWPTICILENKGVIRHVGFHGEDLDQADQRSAS
jgi:hypothetical protein